MAPQEPGSMIVTYSALDRAAEDVQRQAKRLETELKAIQTEVKSVSQLWAGKAHTAYETAQRDWDNQAQGIHDNLTKISQQIAQAVLAYKAADNKAASNF
ncbi:WXG100 family type VII secretion target [Streptomyces sp. NPDC091272]|uniref:WXG100 family type VII secretion target n=1 Tax=Streptomyces sp. NPDC091272 TaxID=3365981 RepID=UPI0038148371